MSYNSTPLLNTFQINFVRIIYRGCCKEHYVKKLLLMCNEGITKLIYSILQHINNKHIIFYLIFKMKEILTYILKVNNIKSPYFSFL